MVLLYSFIIDKKNIMRRTSSIHTWLVLWHWILHRCRKPYWICGHNSSWVWKGHWNQKHKSSQSRKTMYRHCYLGHSCVDIYVVCIMDSWVVNNDSLNNFQNDLKVVVLHKHTFLLKKTWNSLCTIVWLRCWNVTWS